VPSEALPDPPSELVAAQVRGYTRQHPGQEIAVLEAGCGRDGDDLGLRDAYAGRGAGRSRVKATGMDDDGPLTRSAAAARTDLDSVVLGDMRTVPLLPRSFDIVHCDRLLERIPNAELVLDRLVNGLRPGGLLVLRMADRYCAAGFIDRKLPGFARRLLWRWLHPGQPGPFPAVYERIVSSRGIQWFVLMRGLVIAERRALADSGATDPRTRRFAAVCRLVARLSVGRITAGHDGLLWVIKKPENRFARVLLTAGEMGRRRPQGWPPPIERPFRPRDWPAAR
jgi:SAM-dependent methyltransferase